MSSNNKYRHCICRSKECLHRLKDPRLKCSDICIRAEFICLMLYYSLKIHLLNLNLSEITHTDSGFIYSMSKLPLRSEQYSMLTICQNLLKTEFWLHLMKQYERQLFPLKNPGDHTKPLLLMSSDSALHTPHRAITGEHSLL